MPKKMVYIDPYGGASGDMLLGALMDLGVSTEAVNQILDRLGLGLWVRVGRVQRGGLAACKATVMVGGAPADDPATQRTGGPGHSHEHGHADQHEHDESHTHEHADHSHRSLAAISGLIQRARLSAEVTAAAIAVFERLAVAEAAVHGSSVEAVHFHEVGAADAIGDIVGVCGCLELLGWPELLFGSLPTGRGTIRAAHGELPVPAPATLRLLQGMQVFDPGVQHEMLTPTGAALLTALGRQVANWPRMQVVASGIGAGMRDTARANVVRAVLGQQPAGEDDWHGGRDEVILAETNLDDVSGQLVAAASQALLAKGALDSWWAPVGMKKGRPGTVLSFLCHHSDLGRLALVVFEQLPTLGLRWQRAERYVLERTHVTAATSFGEIRVKVGRDGERVFVIAPEYDDCAAAAARHGVPVRMVQHAATLAAASHLDPP